MADTPTSLSPAEADLAAADRAAEAAAASGNQAPTTTETQADNPARANELDDSLAEVLATTNTDGNGPKEAAPAEPAAKPAEVKPAEAAPEAKPAEVKPAERKGGLEDLLSDATKPSETKPNDPAEDIKLRSDASPKTRETFEQLKTVYKTKLDNAAAEAAALKTRVQELEAKTSQAADPERVTALENELKELRAHRAQFDTENDPEFKSKFDTKIDSNYEEIYARLKGHGLKDEVVASLKAMPRAERDKVIDGMLDKVPDSRRFIDSKLVENESVANQRQKELAEARVNADKILQERRNAPGASRAQSIKAVAEILRPIVDNIDWIKVKDIPSTAGAEEKKSLESFNEFAVRAQDLLKSGILDDSPKARADAALALPLAHYFKRELDSTKASLAAATAELEAIRKAGRTSRTASTSASPGSGAPKPAKPNADAGDAVDVLFNEISANAPRT